MWYVFWVILSANKPEDHRWISKAEQSYIINSISKEKKRQTITVSQHLLAPLLGTAHSVSSGLSLGINPP